jgi:hypothetical protein
MCNSIDSDNDKASDRINNNDNDYASDNANDRMSRVIML